MKKFLKTILFLCALSSIAYAEDDAMTILNKKRAEIEKAEKAKAKLAKEAEEKARKEAEEQAKSQVVEVVEAPAEAVVATEGLNPQDEQEAMEILDGMRKKIKKEDAETLKLQQEAKELGISTSEVSSLAEIEAMVKAKKAEQAKSQVVEVVEAPAEAVVATENLNPQDEKEAMEILDGMRKKIKEEDAETLKLQQEAKELGISTSEASSLAEIEAMVKTKKAEQAKPKTEAEKLESTRKEALEKLDFYERVVRSVAREEAEVAGYYEIMNDEQPKAPEAPEAPVAEEVAPVAEPVQQ